MIYPVQLTSVDSSKVDDALEMIEVADILDGLRSEHLERQIQFIHLSRPTAQRQ